MREKRKEVLLAARRPVSEHYRASEACGPHPGMPATAQARAPRSKEWPTQNPWPSASSEQQVTYNITLELGSEGPAR